MTSATLRGIARLLPTALVVALLAACSPTTTTAALRAAEPDYAQGWNAVAVDGAPEMPRADFVDANGEPFDLRAAIREKPTLVYFGYTNCPDICPVHLANIAQTLRSGTVRSEQINVVLVTTDPARDTPEVLGDYLDRFDASFIGLWAPQEEVDRVVVELDLPKPVLEKQPGSSEYTVGHPGQVLAFDTQGRARLAYPFGTRQSQWAQDLPKLVNEDWS
ncbi:MAG TPA: SCO family protein [Euzebyales bacterium]|nr:SCO family protein [Euzebyales bacterium]